MKSEWKFVESYGSFVHQQKRQKLLYLLILLYRLLILGIWLKVGLLLLHCLVGAGLELAHISACEAIGQACTVRQLANANPRTVLQASSFNTASGAEAERIQKMFGLLCSSVQPCSFGLGTLGLASKQHPQIAAWKLLYLRVGRGSLCMVAAGLTLLPISLHRKAGSAARWHSGPCSAASALVAAAASIHCASELLKLLKELSTHWLSSQDWPIAAWMPD